MFNLQNFKTNLIFETSAVNLLVSFSKHTKNVMNFDLLHDCTIKITTPPIAPLVGRISISFAGTTARGTIFNVEAECSENLMTTNLYQVVSFGDISQVSTADFADIKLFAQAFENSVLQIPHHEISYLCHHEFQFTSAFSRLSA